MEYQLYENSEILLNGSPSNSKSSWNNMPSDSGSNSMDNNDYFNEWNTLKIDEKNDSEDDSNTNSNSNNKRKRKLLLNDGTPNKINKSNFKIDLLDDANKQEQIKKNATNGSSKMPPWQVQDITDLNGEIDRTLSLGSDLVNTSYNDAILTISGLTVFKQELPSPTGQDNMLNLHRRQNQSPTSSTQQQQLTINNNGQIIDENGSHQNMMINDTINQLLNQSSYSSLQTAIDVNLVSSPSQDNFNVSSTNYGFAEDCRFQYVLAAATSIATKVNEDTLTYLNQGQSYEIKLKKLGDLSMYRGKMLKSIIRICFHERRLQYMEKEQMTLWQHAHPGDRILEVDVPLSYGAYDIIQPTNALNIVHFTWDPTKEVGVYIKVNCISTEFTPKKHGGEKGVPFRIQVETYQNTDNLDTSVRLHAAACQIKVFKLKGADRKHKQDREKIMKRPLSEQEKYQPSYECTVLNDISSDAVLNSPPIAPITHIECDSQNVRILQNELPMKIEYANNGLKLQNDNSNSNIATLDAVNKKKVEVGNDDNTNNHLMSQTKPQDTIQWLIRNRFEKQIKTFENFSGADMLRMTRDDLLQICGHADGIRLYNAIHLKPITPKLKIYVCCDENSSVYNAIFLTSFNHLELVEKITAISGVTQELVYGTYLEGPQGIRVKLSDDVICHIKDETMFALDVLQENGKFIYLLKR